MANPNRWLENLAVKVVVVAYQPQNLKTKCRQCFFRCSELEKYLVLMKLHPAKTMEFWGPFEKLKAEPMKGVKLIASYSVFGKWDIAIWFEADSNDVALHFVGDKLRGIE